MARISTYTKDANITNDDKLLGSNYGGTDNQGRPIFTTANFKIADLLTYFSENIDIGGGSLGGLLEDLNKVKTFYSYDENGNLTGISEAAVQFIVNSEVGDNYASATFEQNVTSNVLTFNPDGTLATISDSLVQEVLKTENTSQFASAQKLTNVASKFGSFEGDNFNLAEANIQNIFDTFTELSFANSSYITNIEAEVEGKPLVFRQATTPAIYVGADKVIPDGSIWYDTSTDENKVYIVSDPDDDGTSTWELTEDGRIGASAEKITNISAKFGSFDANNNFTIDTDADYFEAVKTYADVDSATASKVEGLNATLGILDANGNVVKNTAAFLQEIRTDVDANSATAELADNLKITVDGDPNVPGSGLVAEMNDVTTLTGNIDGYLQAKRTINVDADGNIASMQLFADSESSEIRFTADSFKVYNGTDGTAPFIVENDTVKIKKANIQTLSFGDLDPTTVPDSLVVSIVYADDGAGTNQSLTKGEKNYYGIYQGQTALLETDLPVTGVTFNQITGDTGLQGPQGEQGDPGLTAYFHVRYSNDNGATFTENGGTDIGDYIGTYSDNNATASTDVNDYTWVKIIGQDGIQGPDGNRVYTTNLFYQTIVTDGSTPTFDTTNLTYDFDTVAFSGIPTGWGINPPSASPGSGTNALFYVSVTVTEGDPNVINVGNPTSYLNFNGLVTFTGQTLTDGSEEFTYTAIDGAWITTGAIKSPNFTYTDSDANSTFSESEAVTEGTIFNVAEGYIKTPKLWLTSGGDAFFTGQLSVGSGNGNIVIDDNGINVASSKFAVDTSGEVTLAGTITGSTGVFGDVTINSDGISSTNFNIDASGNVTIAGDITGSSGEFSGSLNINDKFLVSSSGAVQVYAGGDTLGSGGRFEILDESGNSKYRLYGGGINFNAWSGGSNAFNSVDAQGGGSLFFSDVAQVYAGNGTAIPSNHGFSIIVNGGSRKMFIKSTELRIDPAPDNPTVHTTVINGDLEVLGNVSFNSTSTGDVTLSNLETRLGQVKGDQGNGYTVNIGDGAVNGTGATINVRNHLTVAGSATIGTNLTVSGDLFVNGTTTTVNTSNIEVDDPLMYLAYNNESSDTVDIGFVGHYSPDAGTTQEHTGFFRSHVDGEYYLFSTYQYDEATNPSPDVIDIADASFGLASLNVDTLNGNVVGNVDGNVTGSAGSAATAGSADQLTNPVLIGGVSFDGSADINLPGVNITGNQDTTGNAATVTDGVYLSADNTLSGINTFEGATHFEGTVDSVSSIQINEGSGTGFKGDIYRTSSATLVLDVSDSHLIGYADQLKNDVKVKLIGDISGEATLPGANPTATPDTIQISTSAGSGLKQGIFPTRTWSGASNEWFNIYYTNAGAVESTSVTVAIEGGGKKVIAEITSASNGEVHLRTVTSLGYDDTSEGSTESGATGSNFIDIEITQDHANPENYRLRVKGAASFKAQILDWDLIDTNVVVIDRPSEATQDPVQNGSWTDPRVHNHRCYKGTILTAFKHTNTGSGGNETVNHNLTVKGNIKAETITVDNLNTASSSVGGRTTWTKDIAGVSQAAPIAVAGILPSDADPEQAVFTFTCFGRAGFVRKTYLCYRTGAITNWQVRIVEEETSGILDIEYTEETDKSLIFYVKSNNTTTYDITATVDHIGDKLNTTYTT